MKLLNDDTGDDAMPVCYLHYCSNNLLCLTTNYTRTINLQERTDNIDGEALPYLLVTSKVTFKIRGQVRDVVLYDKLFDWRY